MAIRAGDSLLFTAGVGATGTLHIAVMDGSNQVCQTREGVTGEKFPVRFDQGGTFTVIASVDGISVGSLIVHVVYIDFDGPVACQVGYKREKGVAVYGPTDQVFFTAKDPALLEVSVKQQTSYGVRLYLKALGRGTPVVQARLGSATGPILAEQELDEFILDTSAVQHLVVNGDTDTANSIVTMSPWIPNLNINFAMYAHYSTFAGGATAYTLNTSDQTAVDINGDPAIDLSVNPTTGETQAVMHVDIEMPPGESSYCFSASFDQHSKYGTLVSYPVNCNGSSCTWKMTEAYWSANETGPKTLTATCIKGNSRPHTIVCVDKYGVADPDFVVTVPAPAQITCTPPTNIAPFNYSVPITIDKKASKSAGKYYLKIESSNAGRPGTPFERLIVIPRVGLIRYRMGPMMFVDDMPDPLFVIKNEEVEFRAVPLPDHAEFPPDMLVWSGTAGASGTGVDTTVTFTELSGGPTDYKTVSAQCLNTATVIGKVVVNQWNVLEVSNTLDFGRFRCAAHSRTAGINWSGVTGTVLDKLAQFPVNGPNGSTAVDLLTNLGGIIGAFVGATYEREPALAERPKGVITYKVIIPATIPSIHGTLHKTTSYDSTESFPGPPDDDIGSLNCSEGERTFVNDMEIQWSADGDYGTETVTFDGGEYGTIIRTVDLSTASAEAISGFVPGAEDIIVANYVSTEELTKAMYDEDIEEIERVKITAMAVKVWLYSLGLIVPASKLDALVDEYLNWIKTEMTKELAEYAWQTKSSLTNAELLPQLEPTGGADLETNTAIVRAAYDKIYAAIQARIDAL